MFGRLGMYSYMQDRFQAQGARSSAAAPRKPVQEAVPYPSELAMLLRMAGVVTILLGGVTLVMWIAG